MEGRVLLWGIKTYPFIPFDSFLEREATKIIEGLPDYAHVDLGALPFSIV